MITLTPPPNATAAMEGNGIPSGWPLGLGNINFRMTASPPVVAPPQPVRHIPSFSSISSSDLDTESTASFFPDQSVQLGRLIGIRPICGNKQSEKEGNVGQEDDAHIDSQGFCTPLLARIFRRPKQTLLSQ
ncbi:uncharacterized protein LOC121740974 [Salvia splendens]|uniref:uncharacterized protein LOC121740974 n=1 Tax=Salvia splendens TaxID=180675 RepID=UPI001C27445F|nr:uncharacterized protein LOC121740974 [Salvia splendens]